MGQNLILDDRLVFLGVRFAGLPLVVLFLVKGEEFVLHLDFNLTYVRTFKSNLLLSRIFDPD
jgi:hypothetical protein